MLPLDIFDGQKYLTCSWFIIMIFVHRDFLDNDDLMYVFRIAHKQVMSGRFNFLILVLKDEADEATLPAELRLYLSKKLKFTSIFNL